jgi:small conductance mechanosensitive channel
MMFLQNTNANTNRIVEDAAKIKDVTWNSINKIIVSIIEHIPLIIAGLIVFLLFWLLAKAVKAIFLSASGKTRLDYRLRILFSRLIGVGIVTIGIFTAFTIFTDLNFGSLVAGLGFTSFVIGFATKDILNNLLSGVLILWQQPFRIGDYLFVGSNQGKVEHIGVRATKLRKDDGELVLIPNGDMYSSALTIRGAGAGRRMLLKISISYECDLARVKEIITDTLKVTAGVLDDPPTSVVVTDLTADGVNVSVYFWINTDKDKPMMVFDEVATNIKKAMDDAGVEMYPPSAVLLQTPAKEPVEDLNGASLLPKTKKAEF